MNESILRHALELLMILPASVICYLPIRRHLRQRTGLVFLILAVTELSFVSAGAVLCARYPIPGALVMLAILLFFYPLYLGAVRFSWPKLLFCFTAAAMLCSFCIMYTNYLTAPQELDALKTFSPRSSLICLGLAFLCILIFSHALTVQLPFLFTIPSLDSAWLWLSLGCIILSALFHWLIPSDLATILIGRIRTIALVVFPLFPLTILLICYLCYVLAHRLRKSAQLSQENSLLQLEAKRFEELGRFQEETRSLRHDFKQHLNVITELAGKGQTEELLAYLGQLEATPGMQSVSYCPNPAVDAVAAHYAGRAAECGAQISWSMELPAQLPMPEAEFCAMLGNLLDNALRAVEGMPEELRQITAICRMLSPKMLGIFVENPYEGKLRFGANGLPIARQLGHGVGLASVSATVHRHHGTLKIDHDNNRFTVSILINV